MNDTLLNAPSEAQVALDDQVDRILHANYCYKSRCSHILWRAKMTHEQKLELIQWSENG